MTSIASEQSESKSARLRQRQFILDARALFKPSEVKPGMPDWFRRAFLAAFPARHRGTSRGAVSNAMHNMPGVAEWLDHEGQCKWWDGRTAFCSEPYGLDAKELASIEAFAAALGCDFRVDPNSWHFPGSTWRIVFFEKKEGQRT